MASTPHTVQATEVVYTGNFSEPMRSRERNRRGDREMGKVRGGGGYRIRKEVMKDATDAEVCLHKERKKFK